MEEIEWQKILYFRRPPPSLLLNYAWLIILAETRTVADKEEVLHVCCHGDGDAGEGEGKAMTNDIRHTLNTLEVMYQRDAPKMEEEGLIWEVEGEPRMLQHPKANVFTWDSSLKVPSMDQLALLCDSVSVSDLLEPSLKRLYEVRGWED